MYVKLTRNLDKLNYNKNIILYEKNQTIQESF